MISYVGTFVIITDALYVFWYQHLKEKNWNQYKIMPDALTNETLHVYLYWIQGKYSKIPQDK